MNKEKLVQELIDIGILKKGKIKLKYGGESNFYFDVEKAYGKPELLIQLSKVIGEQLDEKVNCVIGEGIGGIPLATAIATLYNLKLSIIRSEKKDHGTEQTIEGHQPTEKDTAIIVDDVLTTGKSLQDIKKTLENTKINLLKTYIVINRLEKELPGVQSLFNEQDFEKFL